MYPPIFELASRSSDLVALLGDPLRLYLFGEASQQAQMPYAVWQTIFGAPENYLGDRPDMDRFGVQVDVYAASAGSARQIAAALRDSLEGSAHITAWNGESREADTRAYRLSFTVEFWVPR